MYISAYVPEKIAKIHIAHNITPIGIELTTRPLTVPTLGNHSNVHVTAGAGHVLPDEASTCKEVR